MDGMWGREARNKIRKKIEQENMKRNGDRDERERKELRNCKQREIRKRLEK
jgi:hypothetical protein